MSKQNNIPKLRFPKFREIWKQKVISNLGEIVGGGTPSTTNTEYWDGNIDWYTPTEIGEKKYISNSKRKITTLGLNNSSAKLLPIGTILLTSRASIGSIGILQKIGCTNQGFQSIIVNEKNDCDFVYYMMICLKKELLKRASGSTFLEISADALRNIEVILPDQDEQCKIGSFLSVVDNRIESLEKMLHLQKKYKQGIMQRIFNQTIRFKDENGNQFPDWQNVKIANIGNIVTGSTPSKSEKNFWGGDIIWVTAQDFKSKYISSSVLKLTEQGKNKSRIIPINSILVTCIASIGLNGITKVECATNQQINAVICNKNYYYEFVYYAIEFNNQKLKRLAGQTAVPIISKSIFENFYFSVPQSRVEQKKIADFLSGLDAKIEATQKQMDIARQWKKGLLQQMFV